MDLVVEWTVLLTYYFLYTFSSAAISLRFRCVLPRSVCVAQATINGSSEGEKKGEKKEEVETTQVLHQELVPIAGPNSPKTRPISDPNISIAVDQGVGIKIAEDVAEKNVSEKNVSEKNVSEKVVSQKEVFMLETVDKPEKEKQLLHASHTKVIAKINETKTDETHSVLSSSSSTLSNYETESSSASVNSGSEEQNYYETDNGSVKSTRSIVSSPRTSSEELISFSTKIEIKQEIKLRTRDLQAKINERRDKKISDKKISDKKISDKNSRLDHQVKIAQREHENSKISETFGKHEISTEVTEENTTDHAIIEASLTKASQFDKGGSLVNTELVRVEHTSEKEEEGFDQTNSAAEVTVTQNHQTQVQKGG